jgi:2-amino-4-hydroxy-6-hydroxymethyldihydropteridine diphosphokinase
MKVVYLGLGSNLYNREKNLREAVERIGCSRFKILRASSVYETQAMYIEDQPRFLNMVIECQTDMFPRMVLARLQKIEKALGRQSTIRNGPRIIDIDILFFGKFIIEMPDLQVPHPKLAERRFVLEPLVELAPDLIHPAAKKKIAELLALLPPQGVKKLHSRVKSPENTSGANRP